MEKKCCETSNSLNKSLYIAGWLVLFLFVIIYFIEGLIQDEHFSWLGSGCVVYRYTGLYCLGCGGTRAFEQLLQGHIWASLTFHPAVLYGAVLYMVFMISHTIEYISGGKYKTGIPYKEVYLYIVLILSVFQCLVKNISLFI